MSDYIISCCSTADLTEEHFNKRDIHYICFHYELDGAAYMDDLGKTINLDDFYKAMSEGADTKTSQINVDEYETYFEEFLKAHSIEVSKLCGVLASELGVDANLARRAGLLHDIGKALTAEIEGSHVQIGVDVCRKYNENNEVIHAIEAHHNDVEPKTAIACIVQAADAISAARPAARSENYENYIKRLQKLESICASYEGVEKCYALQAGREIRVMVVPEVINDEKMVLVARQIAKQIEAEMDYPGQIKVNLIRESRVVDYAK